MARLVLLRFHGFATIKVCENVLHQLEISTILYYFACACITYIYTRRIRNRTEICTVPPVFAFSSEDGFVNRALFRLFMMRKSCKCLAYGSQSLQYTVLSKCMNVYYRYIYMFLVLVSGLVFVVKTAYSQRGEAKLSKSCLKRLCLVNFAWRGI